MRALLPLLLVNRAAGVDVAAEDGAAVDGHFQCKQWAAAGECEKNPGYMLSSCPVACRRGQAKTITLALANRRDAPVECRLSNQPWPVTVAAQGGKALADTEVPATLTCGDLAVDVDGDGYGVAWITDDSLTVGDANEFQLELSRAAHACAADPSLEHAFVRFELCVFDQAFGGVDPEADPRAWTRLWKNEAYWRLCEAERESPPLRVVPSAAVPGLEIEVLREAPFAAAARGFLSVDDCKAIEETNAAVKGLGRAHVGGGAGSTSYSDARETLSTNLDVDWDATDAPLTAMAAKTFELASELLFPISGEEIPYEAQEPVNFLHYVLGYEYKPHTDGSGKPRGKRVATTLVYCEAADGGGATIFPGRRPLKFSPRPGDLLFFEYMSSVQDTLHAACPVTAGNKTTLTQWHRLGVTPEVPWDTYESWGKFAHPHIHTRYKGAKWKDRVGRDEL